MGSPRSRAQDRTESSSATRGHDSKQDARSADAPPQAAIEPPAYGIELVDTWSLGAPLSTPGDALERDADTRAAVAMGRGVFPRMDHSGPFAPLAPALVADASARFDFDFSSVRVRTDEVADRRARALQADAVTEGFMISFARRKFAPHTRAGAHLLAHELAHVTQFAGGERRTFRRIRDAAAIGQASLYVTMHGLHVTPPSGTRYPPGSRIRARLEWVIARLTGAATEDLVDRAFRYLDDTLSGGLVMNEQHESTSEREEEAGEITLGPDVALILIQWLEGEGQTVTLSPQRRQLLRSAQVANEAWDVAHSPAFAGSTPADPAWYRRSVFLNQVSRHGAALERFAQATGADARRAALTALMNEVRQPVAALQAIQLDRELANEPAYQLLFERGTPRPGPLNAFLGYADTRPEQVEAALRDREARRTLLSNFMGFVQFGLVGREGTDQTITQAPGRANMPALDARMDVTPQLAAPYRAARGGEYIFAVHLAFPDVFEAFAGYAYRWEVVRAPSTPGSFDATRAEGTRPTHWAVMRERLARTQRYNEADLQRIYRTLGPAAVGVRDLVQLNAVMRYGGAVLRTFLEQATQPSNEQTIVFDSAGLYIVRVRAVPLRQDGAFLRGASVAYMPVFVESVEQVAQHDVTAQLNEDQRTAARIAELRNRLSSPESFEGRGDLETELRQLEAAAGGIGVLLQSQLDELTARRRTVPDDSREARDLDRQIEQLRQRLQMRIDRFGRDARMTSRLFGTFVSDTGSIVRLLLEVAWLGNTEYIISDVTTPRSGMAHGSGDRQAAILAGVRDILEGHAGYGRGHVTIVIDGRSHTLRIEASTGSILSEAIESAATAASIAVIAAAAFTGVGLALLIPIGIVGAVPAGYRLVERGMDSTLRLDLEAAMDVVNIVGSVIGLAQAATPMRMVWLGRTLMITGMGLDGANMLLMGAGVVSQISELEGLPEGQRRARLMEILGGAMLQVGMSVGGMLAHRAAEAHAAGGREAPVEGTTPRTAPDVPTEPGRVQRMRDALPPELHSVPIIENPELPGNTVRAVYENGRLQLEVGPTARTARVAAHANTVLFLRRYEGVIGGLRRLIDRARASLGLHRQALPAEHAGLFGTRGFEARAEVRKLNEIITQLEGEHASLVRRVQELGGDPELVGGSIRREIAALEAQVRAHEADINSFEPGRGFIASEDTTAAARPRAETPEPTARTTPVEGMTLEDGIAHANRQESPADRLSALQQLRQAREAQRRGNEAGRARLQERLAQARQQREELRRATGPEGVRRRREEGPAVRERIERLERAIAEREAEINRIAAEERAIAAHEQRANLLANPSEYARLPCFAADTPVLTIAGPKPIASIDVGDTILAWSEKELRAVPRPVRATHRGLTLGWIHVAAGGTTVRATPGHRFLLGDGRGFVPARELRVGDPIQLLVGGTSRVDEVRFEELELVETTCNLTIELDQTYAVGYGLVVHNTPVANLQMGPYIVYIGRNSAYPGQVYVGITTPPLRGPDSRESQHHDYARSELQTLRARQAAQGGHLNAEDLRRLRSYEFREGMVLDEFIVGIKNVDHARYLEHQNIGLARQEYGADNVMNLRIEEVSTTRRRQESGEMASELEILERAIRTDPDVREAGLCP